MNPEGQAAAGVEGLRAEPGSRPAAGDGTASSQGFARVLLDAVGEGVYAVDLDGRCTFANRECVRVLGYDDEAELLGERMHALIHHTRPDGTPYPQEDCQIYRAHREGRGLASGTEVLFRKDGTSFPVEYRVSAVERGGRIQGTVLTFVDITDRQRVETELDQSVALRRVAGSVARIGGWSLEVSTNQVMWSEELFEILDYPKNAPVIVEQALDQYLPEERDQLAAAIEACATSGTPFDLKLQLVTRLGRRQWARVIGEPRFGSDGMVSHVTGAHQDITAQKETESQVRLLADRLTTTLESFTDAFFTVDRGWRMTYVNRHAEQVLRRTREELLGEDLWETFPEVTASVIEEVYRRAMRTGVSEVIEGYYWEPFDRWLSIRVYPSEQGLAVYFQDVTEQHRAQLTLAWQADLLDKASDAIIVSDLDHRITYWNRGAERLYGYPAEEAVGRALQELLDRGPDVFARAIETVLADDEWTGELIDVARDGTELTVECRCTLVRDDLGRPESVLSINTDVTDRRRTRAAAAASAASRQSRHAGRRDRPRSQQHARTDHAREPVAAPGRMTMRRPPTCSTSSSKAPHAAPTWSAKCCRSPAVWTDSSATSTSTVCSMTSCGSCATTFPKNIEVQRRQTTPCRGRCTATPRSCTRC